MESLPRLVVSVLLLSTVVLRSANAEVTVSDTGGYRKVIVAVSPEVNLTSSRNFPSKLQELFREASTVLALSTRQQLYFEEIIVILPKAFANASVSGGQLLRRKSQFNSDIEILEGLDGRFGPYTLQYSGCGENGLRITIPSAFLTANDDVKYKGQRMVQEWAHYRFGVFDEHGYPGDSRFPLSHTVPGQPDTLLNVTGCTNRRPVYEFKNKLGKPCEPLTHGCFPQSSAQSKDVTSSLMHYPLFSQTTQFCDDGKFRHNRNAQTKQNALCREQSTWSIVQKHKDFLKKVPTKTETLDTKFEYFVETEPKILLVLDTTDRMAIKGRMDHIRNAFAYFVNYALPKDSKVGIMDMKKLDVASWTYLRTLSDTDRLFDTFPEAYGKYKLCLSCAILKGIEAFNVDENETNGFLILATSEDILPSEINVALNAIRKADIKLFVLYFGNATNALLLEEMNIASRGGLFHISDETESDYNVPLLLLYEAFREVSTSFPWECQNSVLVHQQAFDRNSTLNEMPFVIDESIESFHLVLTGPEFFSGAPLIKDQLILYNEENEYPAVPPIFSNKMKIPAYFFTISNPRAGNWKLTFQRKPQKNGVIVALVRATHNKCNEILKVKSWIKKGSSSKPFAVYAQLTKGVYPIANATVTAIAYHLRTRKEVIFQLFDNGEGETDITSQDGIYSRHLSAIQDEGYWRLTINASKGDNNSTGETLKSNIDSSGELYKCCGSYIPSIAMADSGAFVRVATTGVFYVDRQTATANYAPRRITDLQVLDVGIFHNSIKHYTLQWTAPGNRYDEGTAFKYEVKIFLSRVDALENFANSSIQTINEWKIHGPWLRPEPCGTLQSLIIELSNLTTGTYFTAMRAINANGIASDVSNVVEVYFVEPTMPTQTPYKTDINGWSTGTIQSTTITTTKLQQSEDINLAIIIGVTCGLLFLLLVLGVILLIYLPKRCSKVKTKSELTISDPYMPRKNDNPLTRIYSITSDPKLKQIDEHHSPDVIEDHQAVKIGPNGVHYTHQYNRPWQNNVPQIFDSKVYILQNYLTYQDSCDNLGFQDVPLADEVNVPFNPDYTSSLKRRNQYFAPYKEPLGTDV